MTLSRRRSTPRRPLDVSRRDELRQSGEIAGSHRHDEAGAHAFNAPQHRLRHAPGRFRPAESLFDAFAVLEGEGIAGVPCRSAIDGGMSALLGDMRCDAGLAEICDKAGDVLAAIRPEGQSPGGAR